MRRLVSSGCKKFREGENYLHSLPFRYCSAGLSSRVNHFSSTPSLIGALVRGGGSAEYALFEATRFFSSGIKPNANALVHLLRAATNLGWDPLGHQLHGYVLRSGYYSDVYVSAALIRFYVRMQSLGDAHKLFVEIPQLNVVSWNTLISGYVHSGQFRKALYVLLELEGNEDYVYVMMSNLYASYGRWEDVRVIRDLMRKKQVRKEAGSSWIEAENFAPHAFTFGIK